MPKILTTKGLAASLEDLIRKAQTEIVLISYSFKISSEYVQDLKRAAERGVTIKLIYGERINPETYDDISQLKNAEILHHKNLHAKIYANENKCIVGSMNFYDYSELNNTELGALFSKQNDLEAYSEVAEHCKRIHSDAKLEYKNLQPQLKHAPPFIKQKWNNNKKGLCIRCSKEIKFDPSRPLCEHCFSVWNTYGNEYYIENCCHNCGRPGCQPSVAKPECPECYFSN